MLLYCFLHLTKWLPRGMLPLVAFPKHTPIENSPFLVCKYNTNQSWNLCSSDALKLRCNQSRHAFESPPTLLAIEYVMPTPYGGNLMALSFSQTLKYWQTFQVCQNQPSDPLHDPSFPEIQPKIDNSENVVWNLNSSANYDKILRKFMTLACFSSFRGSRGDMSESFQKVLNWFALFCDLPSCRSECLSFQNRLEFEWCAQLLCQQLVSVKKMIINPQISRMRLLCPILVQNYRNP